MTSDTKSPKDSLGTNKKVKLSDPIVGAFSPSPRQEQNLAEAENLLRVHPQANTQGFPRRGINVLLVEDDPFLVDIYTTKLREHNYTVEVSLDGQDAVDKIIKTVPDLILLDIVLPKMDGIEVLKTIKANPKTTNAKVIVLSNLSQTYEVSKALEMGAVSYLIKSHYSPSEVMEEIKKYL